jgi:curli biogenesis system outer membrane secretion channel CsgG
MTFAWSLPFKLSSILVLCACVTQPDPKFFKLGSGNLPVLSGTAITENPTPIEGALRCYGGALSRGRKSKEPIGIAVGDVRDFTGRMVDGEGAPLTQGAGLMVYSALAGLGRSVRIHERLDTRIAELELNYADKRQLGDGRMHEASPTADPAPWLPYMGGSILKSDYYIVGGITELNSTISTGGGEAAIGGIGGRMRRITINVAVDLRIVNSANLVVTHAVSLQKQVTGYEYGVDIFRFFGTKLFDISSGSRMSEPLQMAVRSVIQLATLDLLEAVSGIPNHDCVIAVQPDSIRGNQRPEDQPALYRWPPDPQTASSPERLAQWKLDRAAARNKVTETAKIESQEVAPPSPSASGKPELETPASAPVEKGAAVIGAATSLEAAQALWLRQRGDNKELLSAVDAELVSVGRPDGPFLIVVSHRDKSPSEFCKAAKTAGLECEVAPPQVIAARDTVRSKSRTP